MLSTTYTVNVAYDDISPFDFADTDVTLREALFLANANPDEDTILFSTDPADGLNGATITLGRDANGDPLPGAPPGALTISESLMIDATALTNGITIDASGNDTKAIPVPGDGDGSSVFNLDFDAFPDGIQATFAGLTITGGDANRGGGINLNDWGVSLSRRVSLTIVDTVIENNFAGDVGGGVNVYGWERGSGDLDVNIIRSTIENNTAGTGDGGGIYVAMNGGVAISDTVLNLLDSTVSNNEATNGDGGGIWVNTDEEGIFNAINSTISGNRALNGRGGGLAIGAGFSGLDDLFTNLDNMTITDNVSPDGGGLFSEIDLSIVTTLTNTIVSGNRIAVDINSTANNIAGAIEEAASNFNLIGTGVAGDPANNDPGLAPLANNGGPTKTHMPNALSPVIDAGDPNFGATPEFDQRGDPYTRVFDGDGANGPQIDIGAVEYGVGTPRVTDVILEGSDSAWIRDPFRFSTIIEAGQQLRPIFAEGIDTIKIQFSEDVVISANGSELTLVQTVKTPGGGATNTTFDDSNFSFVYLPEILTGVWTFDQPISSSLANGKYAIKLSTSITGGGEALDGDWDNDDNGDVNGSGIITDDNTPDDYSDDIGRAFLSGDGVANSTSGLFRFHFALLAGDYNQDGVVDLTDKTAGIIQDGDGDGLTDDGTGTIDPDDLAIVDNAIAAGNIRLPVTNFGADLNDDEIVDGIDLAIWQTGFGDSLAGDIDGDGDVDGADFMLWQRAANSRSAWYDESTAMAGLGASAAASQFISGIAPQVTNVTISGSISLHAPYSFDTVDGSGTQLQTVPVGGADTISITFSELVNISSDSLSLIGLQTANVPVLAEFSYDSPTMTATWRYEGWSMGDQYLMSLSDTVTDVEGNFLDGEWVNPTSTSTVNAAVSEFPSGDGTAGGHFNFVMTLLPGDANLDGVVDITDYDILVSNYISPSDDDYNYLFDQLFEDSDFNGDGMVNGNDSALMFSNWGLNLQNVSVLADLNGDFIVDANDLDVITDNYGMTGATYADGDLNGDGIIGDADLDLAFEQFGLGFDWVA